MAGEPTQIETADVDRLRAVGLTDFDVLDLNYAVASTIPTRHSAGDRTTFFGESI